MSYSLNSIKLLLLGAVFFVVINFSLSLRVKEFPDFQFFGNDTNMMIGKNFYTIVAI